MATNHNYGHLSGAALVYAENPALVGGAVVHNPTAAQYLSLDPPEKRLDFAAPTDPAPTGYHWEAQGYEEGADTIARHWVAVEDPPPAPRKFSKLKIYGTISSLPEANGTTAWAKIETWLRGKEVGGVNGWMAFQLAQEISEDHPLFAAWADEARQVLGLDQEQFDALLAACVLED